MLHLLYKNPKTNQTKQKKKKTDNTPILHLGRKLSSVYLLFSLNPFKLSITVWASHLIEKELAVQLCQSDQ